MSDIDLVPVAPQEDPLEAEAQQIMQVPVTIYVEGAPASPFIVEKLGAWKYEDEGVFATGHWRGFTDERDVLIPYHRVLWFEFDFASLVLEAVEEDETA